MSLQRTLFQAVTKGTYVVREAPTLGFLAASCAVEYLKSGGGLDAEAVERATVGRLFKDRWTPEDKRYFNEIIQSKNLSKWALPISFFRLPDSLEQKFLKDLALHRAHVARKKLVSEHLPKAQKILDIGGAVDIHPEGALPAMGYPYRPIELSIVDIPDEIRGHRRGEVPLRDMETADGIKVRYFYTGMTNLSAFESNSFDMVWSGQSIEHVTEEEAEKTISEVYRVLKPGGYFCLDTPNRMVTRLISKGYLHPEHKLEYTPKQLAKKIESAGFQIEHIKAITPVPHSVRLGRLSKLEVMQEACVNDDYENGFSFYIQSIK